MLTPTTHQRLSPSKSSTWLACPFSLTAPPSTPSAAADEGTAAHGWAAGVLTEEFPLAEVPAEFLGGVSLYVEHVWGNGVKPIVERKWESIEIDDFGGTIDCLLLADGHSVVYDLKYGRWPVAAEDNTQLLCYSSIIAEHFDVTQFHGVIVQPNAFKGPKIKVAEYSPVQVDNLRERVKWAVENPDHKEVGDHCRFCELRKLRECREGMLHGIAKGWKT